jgi:membrane-bound metal-dependent hydrolase YbcI (DUF457 family)
MVLGYLSHILADMLTPRAFRCFGPAAGAFVCPSSRRKRQPTGAVLCMALFACRLDAADRAENSAYAGLRR